MFDELFTKAYSKLKHEILSAAGRLLIEAVEEKTAYYSGQIHMMNEGLDIMNKIDEDLHNELLAEVQKESAYYEAEQTADESRSKQL